MPESTCPFCKETVKADAVVCPSCHARLKRSREEMLATGVAEVFASGSPLQLAGSRGSILSSLPTVTDCNAWCAWRHRGDQPGLKQCLDDCKAQAAIKAVAEKLHAELYKTFIEVIWGGGNIDPRPLEKKVRELFAKGS